MRRTPTICAMLLLTATAATAGAQGRGRPGGVPPGHRPPAGSCRVWVDGVPPGQQPAPTDCETARRTLPQNASIIYGDEARSLTAYKGKGKKARHRTRDYDRERDRDDDRRCDDRDRNGRCDAGRYPRSGTSTRVPRTLPEMISVVLVENGRRSREQERWLGRADVVGRYTDANRDGRPERIIWRDRAGQVVQLWHDDNHDGRADHVAMYRNGRVVRVVR